MTDPDESGCGCLPIIVFLLLFGLFTAFDAARGKPDSHPAHTAKGRRP